MGYFQNRPSTGGSSGEVRALPGKKTDIPDKLSGPVDNHQFLRLILPNAFDQFSVFIFSNDFGFPVDHDVEVPKSFTSSAQEFSGLKFAFIPEFHKLFHHSSGEYGTPSIRRFGLQQRRSFDPNTATHRATTPSG